MMDTKEQELIEALDVAQRKHGEAFRKWSDETDHKLQAYREWAEAYSNWDDAGCKLWLYQKSKAHQGRKAGG